MIQLYRRTTGNKSVQKIETWLKQRQIPYQVLYSQDLTPETLTHMLKLSNSGFESLIVSRVRGKKIWQSTGLSNLDFENLTINQMITFLLEEPKLLRTPILFDEYCMLAGYNKEELRLFLPRVYRQLERGMESNIINI